MDALRDRCERVGSGAEVELAAESDARDMLWLEVKAFALPAVETEADPVPTCFFSRSFKSELDESTGSKDNARPRAPEELFRDDSEEKKLESALGGLLSPEEQLLDP